MDTLPMVSCTGNGINWKVQRVIWKSLPYGGPEGNQTFQRGPAPKESLITQGPPVGKFSTQTLRTLHRFSEFWIKTVKIMRPRVRETIQKKRISYGILP